MRFQEKRQQRSKRLLSLSLSSVCVDMCVDNDAMFVDICVLPIIIIIIIIILCPHTTFININVNHHHHQTSTVHLFCNRSLQ